MDHTGPKTLGNQSNGEELAAPATSTLSSSLGNGPSWDIWGKRVFGAQGSQGNAILLSNINVLELLNADGRWKDPIEGKTGSSALGGEYEAWPPSKTNWVGGTSPGTTSISHHSRSPGRFNGPAETNGHPENRNRQGRSPSPFFSASITGTSLGNNSSFLENNRFSESVNQEDGIRGRSSDGRKAFGKHQRFKSVGQSVFEDDRRMHSMLGGLEPVEPRGRVMSTSHALDMMSNLGSINSNVDRSESLPPRHRNDSASPYEAAEKDVFGNYSLMPNPVGHQSQAARARFEEFGNSQHHEGEGLSAFRHLSVDDGPEPFSTERRRSFFGPYGSQNSVPQNPYPRLSEYTFPRNEVGSQRPGGSVGGNGSMPSYSPWNRADPPASGKCPAVFPIKSYQSEDSWRY